MREDGYDQLVDGEPIVMESNEVFKFKCCDCGLVHNMVIATEEAQEIGFVVERESGGIVKKKNEALRSLQDYTFKDTRDGNTLIQFRDVINVINLFFCENEELVEVNK